MFWGFLLIILVLYFVFRTPMHEGRWDHYRHMGMMNHMGMHDVPCDTEKNKALEILDTRYVNGEIGDEEYKTKKANLS